MPDRSPTPLLFACLLGAACSIPAPKAATLHEPAPAPRRAPDPPQAETPAVEAAIELCDADSDALADARARYDALDAMADALDAAATPSEFVRLTQALYQHECLAVGRLDQPGLDLNLATGIEARAYWDAGLGLWFRAYLDLADGAAETVWLLPSRPVVVTPQTKSGDPLTPWMCSADPEDPCAKAVSAWRIRAQRTLELFEHGGAPAGVDCDPERNDWPEAEAYARWRGCQKRGLRRQASLPLGGLGAIEDGWIVVFGRRGHYQYCDELAAFDLESGAYYRFADCDHRPELDGLATAAGVTPAGIVVETGTISTELLREFAWVALSIRYVQRNVVTDRALGRPLPPGVRMARSPGYLPMSGFSRRAASSSGHTTLGWIWTRGPKQSPADGELSWPDGRSDPAEDHAVRLMAFAERRAVRGCAPKKLPAWILGNVAADQLPKSDREMVDPPSEALLSAMRAQIQRGRCVKR